MKQSSLHFSTQSSLLASGAKSFAMQSLAEQVTAFMNWRSETDGKEFTPTALAEAVARHQLDQPPEKRCKRQNIEQLISRSLRTTQYLVALAKAMGTTAEVLQAGRFVPGRQRSDDTAGATAVDFASIDRGETAAGKHEVNSGTAVYRIAGESNRDHNLTLPQFDTGGSMGRGLILKDQPGVIHSWNVSEEWAHKNLPSNTGLKNLCIVTGFGPSMRPLFNPGDPLVCDRGVRHIDVDAIYFFRVGDEGYIKHIQRIPNEEGGVNYVVISENEKYKPWTITPKMDLEVFGKVLKVWKGEEC